MQTRRAAIAAAGIAASGLLAGCLSVLLGADALTFSAGPVRVPQNVLVETGYEFVRPEALASSGSSAWVTPPERSV